MYNREEDAILEFELFLVSLDQGDDIKIEDFLQFVAAVDRVPITGFSKPIEIFFVDQTIFPKTSTCGLALTLPIHVTQEMLNFAVKHLVTVEGTVLECKRKNTWQFGSSNNFLVMF